MAESEYRDDGINQDLLPEERRKIIHRLLLEHGSVRTTALAAQMEVNPVTVRRDLRDMAALDEVRLVHGGAVLAEQIRPITVNYDLDAKRVTNIEAKTEIAKKAASLINDGDIVAFSSGSTVELIAKFLPPDFRSLTIVTLGLNVACTAAQHAYVKLIMPGGTLHPTSQSFVGLDAVNFLSGLRIDKGFFGAQAVDIEAGFTDSDLGLVATHRQLFEVCMHSYLVADSSKFDHVAVGKICELDEFDGLIVDSNAPPTLRSWAATTGVHLI